VKVYNFDIYVPQELFDEIAGATSEDWANSYLHQATFDGERLVPRTNTGWEKMRDHRSFMLILNRRRIRLIEPPLFHERPENRRRPMGRAA
jgi:hypothetical protein